MAEPPLRVLFAPDWRGGAPYQSLLAAALVEEGIDVRFFSSSRRVFPLTRGLAAHPCDILHMHWPDAYYPQKNDAFDWFRRWRFVVDIVGATKKQPMVITAHNLYPHNRGEQSFIHTNTRIGLQRAAAVIAHSDAAKRELVERFHLPPSKFHVIPHGDLSVALGEPLPRGDSRHELGLDEGKVCLMFGAIEPYKGIEDVIEFWKKEKPEARLAIIGKPISEQYAARITGLAAGSSRILLRFGWVPDEQLKLWLSAADCVLFNYRAIFTSGAACLARSFGVPLLIPERLRTVDLDEPSPLVFRFEGFEGDFSEKLADATRVSPDYFAASPYREKCAWSRVARSTVEVYRDVRN
jgi:glycosyltransferase involved in cell wall biosynthesis